MDTSSSDLDRFIHSLIAPLTALQGALGLLRRSEGDEQRVLTLLATIERNVERLRASCDQILSHAELIDDQIQIVLPTAAIGAPASGIRSSAAATQPRDLPTIADDQIVPSAGATPDMAALILLIARSDTLAPALSAALMARGHRLVWAQHTSDGIDMARQLRPGLIILDLRLDDQASLATHVLGEDPETKMIPLVQIGDSAGAGEADEAQLLEMIDASLDGAGDLRRARQHILIVDDEPDVAQLIAMQFVGEGYLVTVVDSGTEVLRIVRERQFDLILLDLLLPDIDGFTVLGGLRVQPETQLTPIILLSAINSPVDKVRGLQLGADDYITKPFSAAELNARVLAAMRRSEREGGANPSTRLPGNIAIERAISQRIAQHDSAFAVCYCDIDNFKAYNDTYGFLRGDAVIQRTAQILLDTVREYGNPDDFVGHIGGDDFVLITSLDRLDQVGSKVIERFDATAPLLYDREARVRGFISGEDRQGRPTTFPLVSLSIVAVSSWPRPPSHPGEVAQRSVESKKRAKLIPGSVFVIDE